jgi:hypothetical protein
VYDYAAGKADWLANGLPSEGELASEPRIGSLASRDVPTCRLGDRVGDIHADLCVVVNSEGIVLGDLRGKALHAPPETLVEEVMNPAPSTFRPNISVHEMAHDLAESNARRVLVSDADGRLIGLLRRHDVEHALHTRDRTGPVLAFNANSPSKKEADNERTNG